ncbi:MAG TPA: hypothetical protein VMT30_04325 [Candidatus Saccharimonadia bacterium]|nr:hypothetical protein [Candidatus Saccharimonadia bacterium]
MQTNTLDAFLDRYISGYLLDDIESIQSKIPVSDEGNGAYLVTGAICSGIELLGTLLQEHKESGAFPFDHYCAHYLSEVDERYKALGVFGRQLIRNGIAHTFSTKGLIAVTRQGSRENTHLVRYSKSELLVINANYLHEDFQAAYTEHALPKLVMGGELRDRAEENYERLKNKYAGEIEEARNQAKNKLKSWPWRHAELEPWDGMTEMIEYNGEGFGVS